MDSYSICALLKNTCSRQQVRLEFLYPVSAQRRGHLLDLSNQTGVCSRHQEGCHFVLLVKGPVGASLAKRQCLKAAPIIIMSIIKDAESLVIPVTSP